MIAAGLGMVLTVGGVAACGEGDPAAGPTAGASPTATSTAPQETPSPTPTGPEVELFEFTITGGMADPPLERVTVPRGATVRIVVTSDEADSLHLHGYDETADLEPGQEAVLEFVADQTGLFELETHHSQLQLLQLVVR